MPGQSKEEEVHNIAYYEAIVACQKELINNLRSRNDTLIADNTKLTIKLEERETFILIFKVRSRIEELEKKFLRPRALNDDRYTKWRTIMFSSDAGFLSNPELVSFRRSVQIDYMLFIDTVCLLHGDFDDTAAPKVLFGIKWDKKSIQEMLAILGITVDDNKILAVESILAPISLPSTP